MSIWYKIIDQLDVELSDDGKTIEINYSADYTGNIYIEVPVEFIKNVLKEYS